MKHYIKIQTNVATVAAIIVLAVVAAMLSCCTLETDGDCELYVKPHQYTAELLVRARIEQYWGTEGELHNRHPVLYWCAELCTDDESSEYNHVVDWMRDGCYGGHVSLRTGTIFVADRGLLHETAFVHEIGHWALLITGRDPDGDHSDRDWWSYLSDVNRELYNRGW